MSGPVADRRDGGSAGRARSDIRPIDCRSALRQHGNRCGRRSRRTFPDRVRPARPRATHRARRLDADAVPARIDADDRARRDRFGGNSRSRRRIRRAGSRHLGGGHRCRRNPVGPHTDPARLALLRARTNPFVHSSVIMRTALVERLGGYVPRSVRRRITTCGCAGRKPRASPIWRRRRISPCTASMQQAGATQYGGLAVVPREHHLA